MTANGTASFNVKASLSDNPIRWLIVGGVLLIAAIVIGTTIMAGSFRDRALDNSKRELENTVLLLSRHFDQQLEDFGAVHNHLMLNSKLSAMSYVGGINVFDADGMLINSSSAWPVPSVSVEDRAYFQAFKNVPQSPGMIVEPVHSRITGVWTTVIARKMTGPHGEFLGVIGRGIEPTNFEQFFESLALGDEA